MLEALNALFIKCEVLKFIKCEVLQLLAERVTLYQRNIIQLS